MNHIKEYPMVGHKWISLFIPYPIFVFEHIYERDGEFCFKLVRKKYIKTIWGQSTMTINGIPAGLILNIPLIIYLFIK